MNTLEQHLAAHQLGKRIDGTLVCQCGDFTRPMPGTYDDPYSEHRAHVAATFRERVPVHQLGRADPSMSVLGHRGHAPTVAAPLLSVTTFGR